jgi:hypothetical protein
MTLNVPVRIQIRRLTERFSGIERFCETEDVLPCLMEPDDHFIRREGFYDNLMSPATIKLTLPFM